MEESYSIGFIRHPFFSNMADEFTDVTTIEGVESDVPENTSLKFYP